MSAFAQGIAKARESYGPLCVGIDPHPEILEKWGYPYTAEGMAEFGIAVVDKLGGMVGITKIQVAFFECFGAEGFRALERVIVHARDAGLFTISDAKRGDISSTMTAYLDAWLAPGAPLESDALTLSPYLGPDSLSGALEQAQRFGKGVFLLAATSNPSGTFVQASLNREGESVAARVVSIAKEHLGVAGVVIGATTPLASYGMSPGLLTGLPILTPGFGAQGASLTDAPSIFGVAVGGALHAGVIPVISRGLLKLGSHGFAGAAEKAQREAQSWLK